MTDLKVMAGKWCSYCERTSHNDSECWSTRPADWKADATQTVAVNMSNMAQAMTLKTPPSLLDKLMKKVQT